MPLVKVAVVALGVLAAATPASAGWVIDEVVKAGSGSSSRAIASRR